MTTLQILVEENVETIKKQLDSRSYRVANELRNSVQIILRGARSGRIYGGHVASAPGEPPAADSGIFRSSWQPGTERAGNVYTAKIETGVHYAGYLEKGTPKGQMAPRPHHEKILDKTKPKAHRIYSEPYL